MIPSRHLKLRRHCLEFKKTKEDYTCRIESREENAVQGENCRNLLKLLEDSAEYWSRHALEAGTT